MLLPLRLKQRVSGLSSLQGPKGSMGKPGGCQGSCRRLCPGAHAGQDQSQNRGKAGGSRQPERNKLWRGREKPWTLPTVALGQAGVPAPNQISKASEGPRD